MSSKIIVLGGGAAGTAAAVKAKRVNEQAEVIILEQGEQVAFSRCAIPPFLQGKAARKNLFPWTPAGLKSWFGLEVRPFCRITHLDPPNRLITYINTKTGREEYENYDKAVLALGKEARPGIFSAPHFKGYFMLDKPEKVLQLKEYLQNYKPSKALVVGNCLWTLQVAEAFWRLDLDVTLVSEKEQLLPLDPELSEMVTNYLDILGLKVYLGVNSGSCTGREAVKSIQADGKNIPADLVVEIPSRVFPPLLQKTGIEVGKEGGVVTNSYMQTSLPHVYAAGDIAETGHLLTGESISFSSAVKAHKQGRAAGANAAGRKTVYSGTLGTWLVRLGGITAGKTGIDERKAGSKKIRTIVGLANPRPLERYYEDSANLLIKVTAAKDKGKLLGAQLLGFAGVDKRLDVFAAALRGGLTVDELEDLELGYLPQVSLVQDPVNRAGMVAAAIWKNKNLEVRSPELPKALKERKIVLIDVRKAENYYQQHIEGAENIPLEEFRERWRELSREDEIVIYCSGGYRSYLAVNFLRQNGFSRVINLNGGYRLWEKDLLILGYEGGIKI